jgi:anti-sigma B factor antagonist
MASIEFRVKVIKSPSGTTATLAEVDGSIDASTIQQFQQVMDKLIEKGVQNLILDCTNVKYINSTGLGTLLKYADTFEGIGGQIAFCRVPSKVMLVMEMLGFNALFNIVPDEAAALRSFEGEAVASDSVTVRQDDTAGRAASAPAAPAAKPVRAPAPVVEDEEVPIFPLHATDPRSGATLIIPGPGKFKSPRSGVVISVEESGRVRFFASKKAPPIEINLPCNKTIVEGVGALVRKCAESLGVNGDVGQNLAAAVLKACENVIDYAYEGDSNKVFQMLVVPSRHGITIKIADHGNDFAPQADIARDERFAGIASAVDVLEHQPLSSGGNLLTLVKNFD